MLLNVVVADNLLAHQPQQQRAHVEVGAEQAECRVDDARALEALGFNLAVDVGHDRVAVLHEHRHLAREAQAAHLFGGADQLGDRAPLGRCDGACVAAREALRRACPVRLHGHQGRLGLARFRVTDALRRAAAGVPAARPDHHERGRVGGLAARHERS